MHDKGNSELTVEPQLEPVERAEAEVPGVVGPHLGINEVLVAEMEVVHSAFSATHIPEPRTMKEAMDSDKAEQWKEAARAEYDSLQEHETWALCDLPPNRKPVGSKWVFKLKYDERGEVNRYKARLVAQEFSQTPRVDFNETGFKQSKADPCLFYKWESGRLTMISIYVDDLILLADLLEEMMQLKHQLSTMFKMTNMGNLSYCLGIGVRQGEGWLQIQQRHFLLNIVKRFGLEDAHPVATPADVSVTLEADDGVSKLVDQQNYQQIIGSLLYASGGTRPDVTFIVGVLARYCGYPNQLHLTAAKRVLRYLKGTAERALTYTTEGNASLTGYSDADWAGDRDSQRSTSGMKFMLQGASITWSRKRQASVALSTIEAEYMALSQAMPLQVGTHFLRSIACPGRLRPNQHQNSP